MLFLKDGIGRVSTSFGIENICIFYIYFNKCKNYQENACKDGINLWKVTCSTGLIHDSLVA
jgi:hypothetical protein